MQQSNFFYFFHSKRILLDNNINSIENKKVLISDIIGNISTIKLILETENKPLSSEKDFFLTANSQINKYLEDINQLKSIGQNLNIEKNRYLSRAYNHNLNLSRQHNKIFIGEYKKDSNEYITIDKRQNIFKNSDLKNVAYKLFLAHKISIKEFRNYSRYGKLSKNLRERLNIYIQHNLLKTGHKKHKVKRAKYQNQEYIYIPKFHRLIRFKRYHSDIFNIFYSKIIYSEINKKRAFELNYRNLYSYSKIN